MREASVKKNLELEYLSVDELVEAIECGLIQEEIPFAVIAEHFPVLLDDWYPGYPDLPRAQTKDDPFCIYGHVKNQSLIIKDVPGLDAIPIDGQLDLEGEVKVWLKREKNAWVAYFGFETE